MKLLTNCVELHVAFVETPWTKTLAFAVV